MARAEEDDATIRDDPPSAVEALADTHKEGRAGEPIGPGTILDGKYEILRLIGAGGMGAVFAARHRLLDDTVAIKVLQGKHVLDEDVTRFLREGRTAVSIKGEHGVRIHDVGTLPSGLPYLVMEYLEGEDLGRVVLARGKLPVDFVIACMMQVCEVLAEAHGKGIVHRDIKPQNIFLLRGEPHGPKVKVLDFGLAKVISSELAAASLAGTIDGALLGSPHFMSPEQIRSARTVDTRTDVWSLGATMYKLLTTEPPFTAPSVQRLLVEILMSPPKPLRLARTDVSEALEHVVMRCLSKPVEDRFATVAEVGAALRAATSVAGSTRPPAHGNVTAPMPAVAMPVVAQPPNPPHDEHALQQRKKHHVQLMAVPAPKPHKPDS